MNQKIIRDLLMNRNTIYNSITHIGDEYKDVNSNDDDDDDDEELKHLPPIITVLNILQNYLSYSNYHTSVHSILKVILQSNASLFENTNEFLNNIELHCKRVFLCHLKSNKSISLN